MGVELFEPTTQRVRDLVGFPIVDADVAVGANINADKIGTGVVDNTEFDRLNGITSALEEQGNKGAVSGYAGLDASQELLLTNFPTGTGLQVLRRNAGNTALEFSTPAAGSDTPWTEDHDADGFDLNDLSNLEFRTTTGAPVGTDRAIWYDDAVGMNFNALTGDTFDFRINNDLAFQIDTNSQVLTFGTLLTGGGDIDIGGFIGNGSLIFDDDGDTDITSPSDDSLRVRTGAVITWTYGPTANLAGLKISMTTLPIEFGDVNTTIRGVTNDLEYDVASTNTHRFRVNNVTAMELSNNTLDLPTGSTITWAGNSNRRIQNTTSGFIFEIEGSDIFDFQIASVQQMRISSTGIVLAAGKNIILQASGAAGFLQASEITDPAAGTDSGKFYVKDVGGISKPFYIGDGLAATDLSVGGETFTWTADHSAAGFDLNNLSLLVFQSSTDVAPAGTVRTIYYDDVQGMLFNALTSDFFQWEINAGNEMRLNATELNLQNNKLANVNPSTITDFTTVTAASGDFIWIIDATDSLSKKVDANDFLGGASQTPWTSNIDAADFSLNNLDKLEFNNNVDTPVITQAEIYFNTATTGMNFNVPTGDEFTYRINGTIEMTVNITELDLLTLNIVGAGTLNTHTIPGGTDTFALLAASQVFTNKDILSSTNRVDIGTFEITSEAEGDIIFRNATVFTRLARGTDNQALVATASTINYESLTLGTHVSGASTDLTDTGVIVRTDQVNTFGAFLNSFVSSTMRIPLSATPTMAVDGDFAIDTDLGANFSHGFIKYFDGEEVVVVGMPVAQFGSPADGEAVTYNATTDEFELRTPAGAGDMVLADIQTVTGAKTFNFQRFILNDASNTDAITIDTSEETAPRTLTIPVLGANRTFLILGLTQITDTEITSHTSTKITITNKSQLNSAIVYDDAATTYGAFLQDFAAAPMRVAVSATPTIAVNGDFAIDTTITDFTTPLIRYFGTESMVVIGVPTAEIDTAPGNGDVLAYNATTDEFEFVAAGGGAQTPWASTIDAADFSLQNLDIIQFNTVTDTPVITEAEIWWNSASSMFFNIPTGDTFAWTINGGTEMTLSATALDLQNNVLIVGLTGIIQFTDSTLTIQASTNNLEFDASSGNNFRFRIADVLEYEFGAAGQGLLMTGNNLDLQGGLIRFDNIDTSLQQAGTDLQADVAAGGNFTVRVDNISEYNFAATEINMNNNRLRMGTGIIRFTTDDATITEVTNDLEYDVATGNSHRFRIANATEMELTATALTFATTAKNIIMIGSGAVGFIQMAEITDPAAGTASGKFYVKDVAGVSRPFYIGEGLAATDLSAGGGATIELDNLGTTAVNATINMGANIITFGDADTSITGVTTDIEFDVATSQSFRYRINNTVSLEYSANLLAFAGTSASLQFAGSADRALVNNAGGFVYRVEAGQDHEFRVAAAIEFTLNATELFGEAGNNIRLQPSGAAGFVQMGEITDPAAGTNSGKFYVKDVGGISRPFYIGDGLAATDLTAGGGSQTPWTSDIDAASNSLNNFDKLDFVNNIDTPVITQGEIYYDNATTGMNFNAVTGDGFTWRINGAIILDTNVSQLTLTALDIVLSNNAEIRWPSSDRRIFNDTNGFIFEVQGSDTFRYQVASVLEWTLDATQILGAANNNIVLTGTGFLQMTENAADPAAGTTSGKFYVKEVGGIARPFYIGDGLAATDLSTGAEVFTWTADHATGGNALTLTDDASPPAGTVASIYLEAGELNFNVAATNSHQWRVNDVLEMILSATSLDLQNNILNIGTGGITVNSRARGDILVDNNTNLQRLALGTNNQVLQSDGLDAIWANVPTGGVFTDEIKAVVSVPQGTTAFPDIIALATAVSKVSGHTFPDGVSEGQVNAKVIVPANIAATPNAKIVLKVMTITANTSNETRWEVKSRNVSDGTDMDVAYTVDTAGTDLTMSAAAETMEILEITMNTAPSAGDEVLILVKRKSNVASDDYAASVHLVEVALKIDRLSVSGNIVFNDQINTYGAFLQDFSAALMRIPVSAAPTIAVNGDFAIDTTITDFSTPLIRYFGTESMVVIAVPAPEIDTAPGDGNVLAYNATSDEFEFVAPGGGAQTPWASTIDAADFSLQNLDIIQFNTVTDTPVITEAEIWWNSASSMFFNVPTGDTFAWTINGGTAEMTLSATELNIQNNDIVIGTGNIVFGAGETISVATLDIDFRVTASQRFDFYIGGGLTFSVTNAVVFIGDNALQFIDTDTTITQVTDDLEYDVASTNTHRFRVNNVEEVSIGNNVIQVVDNLNIQWDGNVNRRIGADTNAMRIEHTGRIDLQISNSDIARFNAAAGVSILGHRLQGAKGTDEVAATELTLAGDGNTFDVTGNTTIDTILGTDWQAGAVIRLHFTGTPTITHNSGGVNDILLGNQANMSAAIDDVLTVYFDGTDWREIGRSVVAGAGGEFTAAWTANHNQGGSGFALLDLQIGDTADPTKRIDFNLVGMTTAITLTIDTNQSTNQTLEIPDTAALDQFVLEDFAQILTNKTINSTNNTITNIVNADLSGSAAITFANLQNIATARLLGRQTAAAGVIEEISLNATLELVATTTLQRAALTGDVTASAGSNATLIAGNIIDDANIATGVFSSITGIGIQAQDLNMNGNSVNLGAAGTIFFSAADTAISEQSSNMFFDVPTTQNFSWDIAGTPEMTLNGTTLDVITNNINLAEGASITWAGVSTRRILHDGAGWLFQSLAGDDFDVEIGGSLKLIVTDASGGAVNAVNGAIMQESGVDISPIGTHTQWIPAGAWGTRTTNGAAFSEVELPTNDIMKISFLFDETTSEAIQFWWEPPAEWNGGTITFNVKWTASSGTGTVIWSLSGHSYTNGDALDVAIGGTPGATAADTLSATNEMQITAESGAVTIAGATKGESVLLQLRRDIADTLSADAELLGINVTYTIDEATKD